MFTMHNFVNAKVGKGEPLLGEVNSINLQKVKINSTAEERMHSSPQNKQRNAIVLPIPPKIFCAMFSKLICTNTKCVHSNSII